MSESQIDSLKFHFESMGLTEGEDYFVSPVSGRDELQFTVKLAQAPRELPEELKPFEMDGDELDRFIWKGNSSKKSWSGARFEVALIRYASAIMEKDPEHIALMALPYQVNMGGMSYEDWEGSRAKIWQRICSEPQIAAWNRDLEENYL